MADNVGVSDFPRYAQPGPATQRPDDELSLERWAAGFENMETDEHQTRLARKLAHAFRYAWIQEAQSSELTVSKAAYIAGIRPPTRDGASWVIELRGFLPVALEIGMDAFAYGMGVLNRSRRTKVSRKGDRYVDIKLGPSADRPGWRRISEKSIREGTNPWMHRGFKAYAISHRIDYAGIAERVMDRYYKEALDGAQEEGE